MKINEEKKAIIDLNSADSEYNKIKTAIENAVLTTRVEVDGFGYDGNETSTSRIAKVVEVIEDTESMTWTLYDNTNKTGVTKTEFKEVLRKATIILSNLWLCESIEAVEQIVSQDSVWLEKYSELKS